MIATIAACGEAEDRAGLESEPQGEAARVPPPGDSNHGPPERWFARDGERGEWAGYGPPFGEAAFSLRCDRAARRLVFNTTEMPPSGPGPTTMYLSADTFEQEIQARASEDGLPNTHAAVPAGAQWLGQLIAASGTLTVRVGGSDPLSVPISDPLRSIVRDCSSQQ